MIKYIKYFFYLKRQKKKLFGSKSLIGLKELKQRAEDGEMSLYSLKVIDKFLRRARRKEKRKRRREIRRVYREKILLFFNMK